MTEFKLANLAKKLKKKYGSSRIADTDTDDYEYISTGVLALDLILGGGIAWGYVSEFAGFSQSGKTTLLQILLANAQKNYNASGIWLDRENAWFNKRAKDLGVDTGEVIIVDPVDTASVEDANKFINDIFFVIPKETYKFICFDSISAFSKMAKLGKSDMGKKALQAHDLFRMVLKHADDRTTVAFSNHRYYRPDVMFGDPTTTSGGEGPKYYTTYRIQLEDKKQIINVKENKTVIGNWIKATVNKTRTGPNYRHVLFPHYYAQGIPYYGGYARLLVNQNYAVPLNKQDFLSAKRNDFKVHGDDTEYSEFEMDEFL